MFKKSWPLWVVWIGIISMVVTSGLINASRRDAYQGPSTSFSGARYGCKWIAPLEEPPHLASGPNGAAASASASSVSTRAAVMRLAKLKESSAPWRLPVML
jgi:hypothetical protein